jgi:hypothetical protein
MKTECIKCGSDKVKTKYIPVGESIKRDDKYNGIEKFSKEVSNESGQYWGNVETTKSL